MPRLPPRNIRLSRKLDRELRHIARQRKLSLHRTLVRAVELGLPRLRPRPRRRRPPLPIPAAPGGDHG